MFKNITAHTHAFSTALKSVILHIDTGNTVNSYLQQLKNVTGSLFKYQKRQE